MSALLQQLDIFELRPLITNLSCKLSTVTNYDCRKQLLCLVSEDNDIVLRYTNDSGQEVLKLISWFKRTSRFIHDVSFDPTGTWLLVLCFDNTLHIVPALAVVDAESTINFPQQPFSSKQMTSFIIPFVGPHECPNSKKCPNQTPYDAATTADEQLAQNMAQLNLDNRKLENDENEKEVIEEQPQVAEAPALMEAFSHDVPEKMLKSAPSNVMDDKTVIGSTFMASSTCPYPLSVVWWQTGEGLQRAIIGYSDGSICFVGLSPNCPFVASTTINSGSVVKLLICKDNNFESVLLLITSSLKQQYKLLLEQKAIKYVYPGDISPTSTQLRDNEWQIVMPVKAATNSAASDSASDHSQIDDDVFLNKNNVDNCNQPPMAMTSAATAATETTINQNNPTVQGIVATKIMTTTATADVNQTPPPTYAQAISRQIELSTTTITTPSTAIYKEIEAAAGDEEVTEGPEYMKLSKKATAIVIPTSIILSKMSTAPTTSSSLLSAASSTSSPASTSLVGGGVEIDDYLGRAGLLPAARARLASLKSLGSKKLNALKLRLSDHRQKLSDEQIPENTQNTFAIMDSPSLTPEILSNYQGSIYTLQNLRNTYLLSALHQQSNSLTVHSMNISLKSLFLYKIPQNCYDILISSNLLYSIQYVDMMQGDEKKSTKTSSSAPDGNVNTAKEYLDKDIEKDFKYSEEAEEIDIDNNSSKEERVDEENLKSLLPQLDLAGDIDPFLAFMPSESVDSSASTTVTSSQSNTGSMSNMINAVGVISSAMASLRAGDEDRFNVGSQLGLFRFENETVLNLYQMATYRHTDSTTEPIPHELKMRAFSFKDIKSPMDYVDFYEQLNRQEDFNAQQAEIMQQEFPKINYDPCYVVTNKNVYFIQLKKEPFAIFLDAALKSEWTQCREFCNTFDLSYEACIEFAGDYLLRRKKVTQALLTYNAARIKPIRTALKLAMFGQTCALMHLCAMALKITYILRSKYCNQPIIESLLEDITYRHAEDVRPILPERPKSYDIDDVVVNEGKLCSNYVYGVDESISTLQMSPSSQFHLSNLLLITLAEKTVNDKNYMPLWNFLATNTKYHTNMTSIVLCQSGLFSAALLLAKVRGVCVDVFMALTSVVGQEFGWYSELNVCLYNLSETLFCETITYMPYTSDEYFRFLQDKSQQIRLCVLERLKKQLDPFSAKLRPVLSHTSSNHMGTHNLHDNNTYLFEFCKSLVETYLAVIMQIESRLYKGVQIKNALSTFRINYEDNQFAIETSRFKPISAGCAHCACVVDGIAYFWGANGIPVYYNINKSSEPPEPSYAVKSLDALAQLNLEVHAVKCGRQHTLILTNNGLYSFGSNMLCQLGIGRHMQVSLQPMLVEALDGKNITIMEVGQYHNAVIADGLLYTWGWGIYGQLGHGDVENQAIPQAVQFFKYKRVLQVSLGHAHSLVLCQVAGVAATDLYVFGSNHFGQLGLGNLSAHEPTASDNHCNYSSQVKSAVPLLLQVGAPRIRLIHTKFFTNLAVDENERMFTWGSSPQALRLANQIKRRANARLKSEEAQRREMSRRFEATLSSSKQTPPMSHEPCPPLQTSENSEASARKLELHDAQSIIFGTAEKHQVAEQEVFKVNLGDATDVDVEEEDDDTPTVTTEPHVDPLVTDQLVSSSLSSNEDMEKEDADKEDVVRELEEQDIPSVVTAFNRKEEFDNELKDESNTDNCTEDAEIKPPTLTTAPTTSTSTTGATTATTNTESDSGEHTTPHLVDTSEVAGQILQISSGLFHFALISSTCTLYTWGKNLEHQLGTEDKERRAVSKPSPIDNIERPMYVECGADFTLVMSTDFIVKAFGGNANGQCGRDLGATLDKMKSRVVCLPTTKRLMRFESQCIDAPVEINLPRPIIRMAHKPVRYLKSIPQFREHFVQEAAIHFDNNDNDDGNNVNDNYDNSSSAAQTPQHKSATTTDQGNSSENAHDDSEDLMSSSVGNSQNDDASSSMYASYRLSAAVVASNNICEESSCEMTQDEHSYERLPGKFMENNNLNNNANENDNNNRKPTHKSKSQNTLTSDSYCGSSTAEARQYLRNYIHYCLYVFHGLYNADKVREFAKEQLEFRIRTFMLNFKFVEAFQLCLEDCSSSAGKTLQIFEYFAKDTGYVPMSRRDLKYLIYYLLKHFLNSKFDMLELEMFFLADLDYYLMELAHVLYFNNSNTMLEKNLNKKFQRLLAQDLNNSNNGIANANISITTTTAGGGSAATTNSNNDNNRINENNMRDTDVIFDCLSVKFKTIVCQRLMELCGN